MKRLTLADVIEGITHIRPEMNTQPISEAVIDSRQAGADSLFFAIPGENVDGHDYVRQAFERGALAAVIEHEIDGDFLIIDLRQGLPSQYQSGPIKTPVCLLVKNSVEALQQIAACWRNKFNIRVIGITGSVGKSTTKEAIAQVLSQRYKTLKSAANLNNEIGLPLNVLKLTDEHECAVFEMGFYVPGEIKLLCDIARPQVGVLTLIGTVHAERAGSREMIARGKGELVEALPSAPQGTAVLNYDDPFIRPMIERTNARVLYYGSTPDADLWADEVDSMGLDGLKMALHYRGETLRIHVPMIGRHSVDTVLRAAAAGLVEGLSWDEIIRGLQEKGTQIRMNVVRTKNGAQIIDDSYNASPESTLAALNLLGELPGRKVAVLGDMLELGPYEKEGHEMVGQRAAQVADILVTLGPRAHMIAAAARSGGMPAGAIHEYDERNEVTAWLKENLAADEVALIKGSHGLHMEKIVEALEVVP